jgi:hypothetical protein
MGSGAWEEVAHAVHVDVDATPLRILAVPDLVATGWNPKVGFGPEHTLRDVLEKGLGSEASVGFVPTAVGASGMDAWAVGGALFNNCVAVTRAAMVERGRPPDVLVFYQGETDACDAAAASGYQAALDAMVLGFRRKLDTPNLSIVLVAPHAVGYKFGSLKVVRDAILTAPTRLPLVKVVDAAEACEVGMWGGLLPDGVHLTRVAQQRLGIKLAEACMPTFQEAALAP